LVWSIAKYAFHARSAHAVIAFGVDEELYVLVEVPAGLADGAGLFGVEIGFVGTWRSA
jgi:L-cystine uptake protein TcyP (sodium:dicarboxylate symporter family)